MKLARGPGTEEFTMNELITAIGAHLRPYDIGIIEDDMPSGYAIKKPEEGHDDGVSRWKVKQCEEDIYLQGLVEAIRLIDERAWGRCSSTRYC